MPTPVRKNRAALPAPRPLSPRAAAYVRSVHAAEAARLRAIQAAVTTPPPSVRKAAAQEPLVPCYDQAGNLVGVAPADAIKPVADPSLIAKGTARRKVTAGTAKQQMLKTVDAVEQARQAGALNASAFSVLTELQRRYSRGPRG